MKTITIKNAHVLSFAKVIDYPMPFQKSRVKNRFLKLLGEKANVMEKSRMEIINTLAEKDAGGKLVLEGNEYKFSAENRPKFTEEYNKLIEEECIIDILPSSEKDIPEIKSMINISTVELSRMETELVEEILMSLNETAPSKEKLSAIKTNKDNE